MDWITADLIDAINETSWFDGIGTILILLATYAAYKWIKKNIQCVCDGAEQVRQAEVDKWRIVG